MVNFLFHYTPLHYLIASLWRDEAFSVILAEKKILQMMPLTARDFNPPLYYILLHFWMLFFGKSEIILRTLSVLFFLGTVYISYKILREQFKFSSKFSIAFLLLFIANPVLNYYAFEVRMYTQLAFFATLSYYAILKKKDQLYIVAAILGMYTHYFMFLIILSQFLFNFFNNKKHLVAYIKKYIYISLLFSPWIFFTLLTHHNIGGSAFWIPKPHFSDLLFIPSFLFTGYQEWFMFYNVSKFLTTIVAIFYTCIIAAIVIYALLKKDHRYIHLPKNLHLLLLLWTFLPVVIIFLLGFIKSYYIPRYLIFSSVGLLLLLAYALKYIQPPIRNILLLILFISVIPYNIFQITSRTKSDFTKTVREIKTIAKKDDVIYTDELDYFTVQYYFDENKVYIYGKSYNSIPDFVGKSLIPQSRVVTQLPIYPKRAFILHNNGTYDIESLY